MANQMFDSTEIYGSYRHTILRYQVASHQAQNSKDPVLFVYANPVTHAYEFANCFHTTIKEACILKDNKEGISATRLGSQDSYVGNIAELTKVAAFTAQDLTDDVLISRQAVQNFVQNKVGQMYKVEAEPVIPAIIPAGYEHLFI